MNVGFYLIESLNRLSEKLNFTCKIKFRTEDKIQHFWVWQIRSTPLL